MWKIVDKVGISSEYARVNCDTRWSNRVPDLGLRNPNPIPCHTSAISFVANLGGKPADA